MGNEQVRTAVAAGARELEERAAALMQRWEQLEARAAAADRRVGAAERALAAATQKAAGDRLEALVTQRVRAVMTERIDKMVAERVREALDKQRPASGGSRGGRGTPCGRLEAVERRVAALEAARRGVGAASPSSGALKGKALRRLSARVSSLETSLQQALGWLLPRVDKVVSEMEQEVTALAASRQFHPCRSSSRRSARSRKCRSATPSPAPAPTSATAPASAPAYVPAYVPASASAPSPVRASILPPPASVRQSKGTVVAMTQHRPSTPQEQALANAFIQAPEGNDEEAVVALLDTGADVNCRDAFGRTVLHAAARSGSENMIRLLLNRGASVALRDNIGWTPLHEASTWGYGGCVTLLLAAGSDIEAAGEWERTALHCAVFNDNRLVVRLLLDAGADVSTRDALGMAPRDLAETESMRALLDVQPRP